MVMSLPKHTNKHENIVPLQMLLKEGGRRWLAADRNEIT